METSLPLATDSFSHSWLSNCKPLEDSLSTMNSGGLMAEPQNFNFDACITQSPSVLAHADELFSDGFIRPVFLDLFKGQSSCNSTPDLTQAIPSSFFCAGIVSPRSVENHHGLLRKWRKSRQHNLRSIFRCLKQLCKSLGCSRKSTRVSDFEKTEWEVKSWSSISQQASPEPVVVAHSMGDLCENENPIYEAVLHCKRSIGK